MKKKIIIKISFAAIAFAAIASTSSCKTPNKISRPKLDRPGAYVEPVLPLQSSVALVPHTVPADIAFTVTRIQQN